MSEWKPLTEHERAARLEPVIHSMVRGGSLESQTATMATIKYSQPINHVLHAILSIFTCGAWLLVWAIIGMTAKPTRYVRVWVDQYGRVSTDDGPNGEWIERMPAVQSAS